MIYKEPSATAGKVSVTFELPASVWAERVNLVGEFNGWDRSRTPMRQSGPYGAWRVTLALDVDREYQFLYLIDGTTWYTDYAADSFVVNEYGTDNSIVRTTGS
jgi:1,4-alpha-glucan branching enzyme